MQVNKYACALKHPLTQLRTLYSRMPEQFGGQTTGRVCITY